jgi:hypothetical protein
MICMSLGSARPAGTSEISAYSPRTGCPNGATRGRRAGARGFLALDGTKLQADASSFQNYDRDRLEKAIGELEKQLQQMLVEAAGQDAAEDAAEQDRDDSATPS